MQLRELDGVCRAATEAGALLRRYDFPRKRARLTAFRIAAERYANTTQIKESPATPEPCPVSLRLDGLYPG